MGLLARYLDSYGYGLNLDKNLVVVGVIRVPLEAWTELPDNHSMPL